jgi:uncharacterized membrane protein YkoI
MLFPLQRKVALFVLLGSLFAAMAVPAAEIATTEIEDVSDAEKIKWAHATKVSVTEAIKTATAHTPGQVIEAALHAINGRLLYEIEVVTKDDRVVEVFVDPRTGKLIQQGELKR